MGCEQEQAIRLWWTMCRIAEVEAARLGQQLWLVFDVLCVCVCVCVRIY